MNIESLSIYEIFLAGIAAGGAGVGIVVFVICQLRYSSAQRVQAMENQHATQQLQTSDARVQQAENTAAELRDSLQASDARNSDQKANIATLRAELEMGRQQREEFQRFQQSERERLKSEFEVLAQKILDEKSTKFTQQNLKNIGDVLSPLREQMGDFKKKVEDVYDKESRDRAFLFNEIKHLKGLNERISQDAINLTNALKGESKTRGNWGEVVLERILEDAGLREGVEFDREVLLNQEDGQRRKPDVIIRLPDKHDLIVDAKVSLAAFEEAMAAEPGGIRDAALARHVQSLRTHVKSLSQKSYQTLLGINTLDFVLMFVPIEPALHAAFAEAPELFQEAYEKNIFIVSPTTLLMACRTVQNLWRTDSQNKNAQEISTQAGRMIDKFAAFIDDLDDIDKHLGRAGESYRSAKNKLESGKGNLLGRAKKIEQLGARGKKSLPEPAADREYSTD